ncbi:uncharacterized protein LOC107030018 [Solanum pennellii]|uniref:Uncharacterized protein LOC107030018 n=1 Tax=Solanum pennellii TaxID=28526 RepID=A0ABM1HKU3_SOLPN|nr:uncharacterized protein LOC107030018 [Solanum pennellii]
MSPYQHVYGKTFHLPVELENKVVLAMKKLKMDWNEAEEQRLNGLNEFDEFPLKSYESLALYKEKMKKYHDQKIKRREFEVGDLVLLFNSRLRLFSGKIKYKWTGPFLITHVFPHGVVELYNKKGARFKVNGKESKSTSGMRKMRMKWLRQTILMKSG